MIHNACNDCKVTTAVPNDKKRYKISFFSFMTRSDPGIGFLQPSHKGKTLKFNNHPRVPLVSYWVWNIKKLNKKKTDQKGGVLDHVHSGVLTFHRWFCNTF